MQKNEQKNIERNIALAGIFQAAALVRDLARTGQVEKIAFDTSIQSIYYIDAISVTQIYGGKLNGLSLGLKELVSLLAHTKIIHDRELTRYLIGLMHLERKLMHSTQVKENLARRLKHAAAQANYFSTSPDLIMSSLADIYIATLGTLPFRLQIVGQSNYLNQATIINKIRAVLLAGIRSTVLWRQLGGSRWQLFLMRDQLIRIGKKLLMSF